ncbi:MAG: sigma-70 family RNA polymerase sigma factor [Clostridia bacterium]|nr:sigma-70 family RNA polymerase sigma factor [Clostridia bacterium]
MIIGEVKRYLRDNNAIRVSRSMRDLAYHALKAREELSRKLGAEPSIPEIAKYMTEKGEPHSEEEISTALEAITEPVSLFDPVYGEGGTSDSVYVMDQISDNSSSEDSWLESIALKEALGSLNEREKTILALRFYKGKTQMEIASEIGISQAQVSRLEKGAIERIKKQM